MSLKWKPYRIIVRKGFCNMFPVISVAKQFIISDLDSLEENQGDYLRRLLRMKISKVKDVLRKLALVVLILAITIGVIPPSIMVTFAAADDPVVTEIDVTKKFYTLESASIYYLTIRGTNLLSANVTYIDKEGKLQSLGQPVPASNNSIVQYEIDPEYIGQTIIIENDDYYIGEENMPMLDNIDPTSVKKGMVDGITIYGTRFANIDTDASDDRTIRAFYYQGENDVEISNDILSSGTPDEVTLTVDNSLGLQNIRFDREDVWVDPSDPTNKVPITITYRYIDIFRIYDDLDISDADQITMYPNRGEKGSRVYFKALNLKEDMSVFFLKKYDGTVKFTEASKGLDPTYKKDIEEFDDLPDTGDEYDQFSVIIPNTLEIGEEYFVVFTNEVEDGKDPERIITKEKLLGSDKSDKFTVISQDDSVQIYSIEPDQGPDTGQSIEINGKYFGSINISDLTGYSATPTITKVDDELVIDYGDDGTYLGTPVDNIQKTVKVFIASDATFEVGKNDITNFAPHSDTIFIRTPSLSLYDKESRENVIITTITTFEEDASGVQYRFEEREEYDGFTFIPSRITPTIEKISPNKMMVRENPIGDGTYITTDDIYLAIHGENFLIHTFKDAGDVEHTRYPVIKIGDDLIIDKNEGKITDLNGESVEEVDLIVLNDEDRILDGSTYNEIGTKIIVKIPAGKVIPASIVSKDYVIKDIKLRVTNPIRNTLDIEPYDEGFVNFMEVSEDNAPKITAVEPYIVTLDGGENIRITGTNFYDGVRVYIDGEEVQPITRSGNGKEITFISPAGREGTTQLIVLNEDGGTAVHDFLYVKTYTNPEVTSISPDKGMANTLVIIDGDNFLPPDPTSTSQTEMGMYRLIGTRVLFDGLDLNTYYMENGKIALQTYAAPTPDYRLIKLDLGNGDITLADHYYSVVLQQEDPTSPGDLLDNFYTLTIKEGEDPVISDGVNETYSVISQDPGTGYVLKAKKEGESPVDLTINDSTIVFDGRILHVRTLYETLDNTSGDKVITGNRVRVKDKTQIFVKVPILSSEGWYDVTVRNPDIKEVVEDNGFYFYDKPMTKPLISSITPAEGSMYGGYDIDIIGDDFERLEKSPTEIIQSRVIIDGIEVPAENVSVWPGGKRITVTIPPYPVDIKEELGLDRLTVPVVVLNSDGGSDSVLDGFTYVNPTSHPEIWEINEIDKGSVYERYLQIIGKDFRYFEPFEDENGNIKYDSDIGAGIDEEYTDVNKNGEYNDFRDSYTPHDAAVALIEARGGNTSDSGLISQTITDEVLPVIPEIKIGENIAEIVEYQAGYILVKVPSHINEDSDVYLVNNDHGVSNKMTYRYTPIIPKITDINPAMGNKKGKTYMEIQGENFLSTKIDVYELNSAKSLILNSKDLTMVRFDEISKSEDIMVSRTTEVNLDGGLTVEYNGVTQQVTVNIKEKINGVDEEYERTFGFTHSSDELIRYIDVGVLRDKSNSSNYYSGYELIKIKIDNKDRLIQVERGFSPSTESIRAGQLQVWTPSYYTIAPSGVTITVVNPNGYSAKANQRFEYTNPIVDLVMTNITDVVEMKKIEEGSSEYYIIESTVDVGITFTIEGQGFIEPLSVKIGGQEAEILPNGVSNNEIRVRAKPLSDLSKLNTPLLITVEIPGIGSVTSADPTLSIPIYYVYREKSGTSPEIYEITPNKGSVEGGDIITIEGKNFAVDNGLSNVIVKIGDEEAEVRTGSTIDKLLVTLPESEVLGKVDIYVKNKEPLGEAILKNSFTYYSKPTITDLDPEILHTTGGENLVIKGTMFMEGVDVTINDVDAIKVTRIDSETIEVITPPIEEEGSYILRVENKDGGSVTSIIDYIFPYPDTPTGLEAYPGNERSIILKWNKAERAERYKIYAVKSKVGDNKNGDSEDFKYFNQDFYYLGETESTEFHIKDLEPNQKYYFRIWSVNGYGSSLDYAQCDAITLTTIVDKGDDKYDDKIETDQIVNYTEKSVKVVFPDFYTEEEFALDLRDSEYHDAEEIHLTVPLAVARRVQGTITIRTGLVEVEVSLYNLSNSVWYKGDDLEDNNVIIKITKVSDAEKARITKYLSKKEEVVSDAFSLEFIYQSKKQEETFSLKTSMDFRLVVDKKDYNEENLSIYKYNPENNSLEQQFSTAKTYYDYRLNKYVYNVTAYVKESGKYIMIYEK